MSSFGAKIKEIRTMLGLDQAELGGLIGTSKLTISNYETGKMSPNLSTIETIIIKLNVKPERLFDYLQQQ